MDQVRLYFKCWWWYAFIMNTIVKLASFFCKDIPKEFDQLNVWQKLWLIFPVAAFLIILGCLVGIFYVAYIFNFNISEILIFENDRHKNGDITALDVMFIWVFLPLPIPSITYHIGRVTGNWIASRKAKRNHQRKLYAEEENKAYAKIGEEIDAGIIDKGLWTKCFADAGGDSNEQKALYLKIKAKQLMRNN